MSEDNGKFMSLMAECTDQCESMNLNDDKWKPPNGDYLVSLDEVLTGVSDKEGVVASWVKPIFTIQDEGEFNGKSFNDFFFIIKGDKGGRTYMALLNLLRLATCCAGTEVKSPTEAIKILDDTVGEFLSIQVYRKPGKKGGEFANIRFLSKVESTEV